MERDGFNCKIENLIQVSNSEKSHRSIQRDRQIPSFKYLDRTQFKKPYGGYSRVKAIGQYDKNGNLIAQFKSIAEVTRQIGHDEKSIIYAAKGRWSHHHGYIWKYIE